MGRPIFLDPIYSSQDTSKQKGSKQKKKAPKKSSSFARIDDEHSSPSSYHTALGIIDRIMKDQQRGKFFLHASTLSIPEYNISVEADLPSWWKSSISELDKERISDK